jgi:signal transduction histidine kinase
MLFVAIFSFLLGTVLTRQLQTLKNATSHMSSALSKGKFKGAKVEEKGNDELTDVARAFNILVDSLEEEQAKVSSYQAELETFNKTLEEKIALRTKELAEAQEVLLQKEKMASIGQLAAGVAHEINNPLAYVRSNLVTLRKYSASYALISKQLLNSESNDTNQILEALKTEAIQQDVEHINQDIFELLDETDSGLLRVSDIVKSLKGFSRVESTSLSSIDVNKCVEDSVKMLSGQVEQKATVILSLDKLPSVEANTGQINQILTNLIMNAGQAFDEINLGNGRETIKIQTKAYDNRIEVKVEDNGIGISKQNLSRIFDPFFTTKPVGSGTGLGLSISYKLAKAHGGDLSVFSTPGLGTVFTLSLPIKAKMRE